MKNKKILISIMLIMLLSIMLIIPKTYALTSYDKLIGTTTDINLNNITDFNIKSRVLGRINKLGIDWNDWNSNVYGDGFNYEINVNEKLSLDFVYEYKDKYYINIDSLVASTMEDYGRSRSEIKGLNFGNIYGIEFEYQINNITFGDTAEIDLEPYGLISGPFSVGNDKDEIGIILDFILIGATDYQNGYDDGYYDGWSKGNLNGYDKGKKDGYNEAQSKYAVKIGDNYYGYSDGYSNAIKEREEQTILYHDIVLPNGVKDEITETSLIDNVGKVVLNGSENWGGGWTNENYILYQTYNSLGTNLYGGKNSDNNSSAISNSNFSQNYLGQSAINSNIFHLYNGTTQLSARVNVAKSILVPYGYIEGQENTYLNAFKSWLQENNLEIYYQLAEPITYDLVTLLTNADGSYKDGFETGKREGVQEGYGQRNWFTNIIPNSFVMVWNTAIAPALNFEIMGISIYEVVLSFVALGMFLFFYKKFK